MPTGHPQLEETKKSTEVEPNDSLNPKPLNP